MCRVPRTVLETRYRRVRITTGSAAGMTVGDSGCFIQNAHSRGPGFFRRRRISCSGRVSPTPHPASWGGLSCEASCTLRPARPMRPTRPWTNSASSLSTSGILWAWQVPGSNDESSAPLRVRGGTCIRNSTKRGPLYHPYPYPASRRPIKEGQREGPRATASGTNHGPTSGTSGGCSLCTWSAGWSIHRGIVEWTGPTVALGGRRPARYEQPCRERGRNGRALKYPQDATWGVAECGWCTCTCAPSAQYKRGRWGRRF